MVAEIKEAALAELLDSGTDGLALRAVARRVGVSVQALYHYFPSRDALVTDLITDAFHSLAAAVTAGAGDTSTPSDERMLGAALAYRRWALDHRSEFLLALGAPLPDYAAPKEGPTTAAAKELSWSFQTVIFGGWSAAELALAQPAGPDSTGLAPALPAPALPDGALALFILGWSTVHGFVTLETQGHLSWLDPGDTSFFRQVMAGYIDTVGRARAAAGERASGGTAAL